MERADDATRDHVRGDERADGDALVDDRHRPHRRQQDGRRQGEGHPEVEVGIGARAALERALDRLRVGVLPHRAKGFLECQRLDGRAADRELADEVVAPQAGAPLPRAGRREGAPGAPGKQEEDRHDHQEEPGDRRRDDGDEGHEQDGERQIGEEDGGGAGEGVADGLDIAKEGLPVGRRLAFEHAQRQGHDPVEKAPPELHIDMQRRALQHAAARLAQDEIKDEGDADADDEAAQGAQTGEEHHPVVDLQHEDGDGQRQQVDEESGGEQLAERAAQRAQNLAQPLALPPGFRSKCHTLPTRPQCAVRIPEFHQGSTAGTRPGGRLHSFGPTLDPPGGAGF